MLCAFMPCINNHFSLSREDRCGYRFQLEYEVENKVKIHPLKDARGSSCIQSYIFFTIFFFILNVGELCE